MKSPWQAMREQTKMNIKIVQTLLAEGLTKAEIGRQLEISRPMVNYYAYGGSWKKPKKENQKST